MGSGTKGRRAERILLGNVLVLDSGNTSAEAVAVADGRILCAGRRDDVMQWRDQATQVHDFGSRTIIPGFNDSHAHSDSLGLKTIRPTLEHATSIAEVLARVRELVEHTPAGQWVVTMPIGKPPYYWHADKVLAEGRLPTRTELDSVSPDHPVYITSPSGYWGEPPCFMVLNSLALKLNGIDRRTRPRVGGVEILLGADGEPSGIWPGGSTAGPGPSRSGSRRGSRRTAASAAARRVSPGSWRGTRS